MKLSVLTIILVATIATAFGQLNPLPGGYYFNRYLDNPALAGASGGAAVYAELKAQWTSVPGAPVMQAFTADLPVFRQMGAGVIAYRETAGLLERTLLKASYAYHIPLGWEEGNSLDFGLNAVMGSQRIDIRRARGDLDDATLYAYNDRGNYFDGDFGVALRYGGWLAQASLPNIRDFVKQQNEKRIADRYAAMASVAYRIPLGTNENAQVEPMAAFRYVQGQASLLDIGCQATFEQDSRLVASAIYHSSGSLTVGIGTTYRKQLAFMASYTSNAKGMGDLSNGEFSVALRYTPNTKIKQ